MKKVLLLAIGHPFAYNYWESSKEAPYPNCNYRDLPGWDDLSKTCPLPGIGRYRNQHGVDYSKNPFVYGKINGMRYDQATNKPFFVWEPLEPLKQSKVESRIFEDKLPAENKKLFSVIEPEKLFRILQDFGEKPPEEWKKLIEIEEQIISWRDYVGKYFLQIEEDLSNDEFEDRVAVLLNAIGFKITQKGHKIIGEYPDGIFYFDDYSIVYDCKNTQNFIPSAEDERAIKKYLNDEKIKVKGETNIYCAFIAKNFKGEGKKDIFYLSINSLLYLLHKRLSLGSKFALSPLKKILANFTLLEKETIDKEWMK